MQGIIVELNYINRKLINSKLCRIFGLLMIKINIDILSNILILDY